MAKSPAMAISRMKRFIGRRELGFRRERKGGFVIVTKGEAVINCWIAPKKRPHAFGNPFTSQRRRVYSEALPNLAKVGGEALRSPRFVPNRFTFPLHGDCCA